MIVLVSLIVLLRGFPCFHDFSHGPFHPYITIHSVYSSCVNAATKLLLHFLYNSHNMYMHTCVA